MAVKNSFRRLPALVFCISCLALLAGRETSTGDSFTDPAKRVVPGEKPLAKTVTVAFFGNCGFLVRVGGRKVLFDLEGPEKASDKAAAVEAYRRLAAAAPPFDDLAVVLISHPHPDHVGIREMAECLEKNRKLKLYSTADTWDELKKAGAPPSWLEERVFVVAPGAAHVLNQNTAGMEVEFLGMLHAGAPEYVFQDLSFVINLEGVRLFFLSDVDPGFEKNREILDKWSRRNERVDLLFSPDSNLYDSPWSTDGARTIKRFIRPERVVAMHIDPRAVDEAESKVRVNFPAAIVFRTAGETVELPGLK